jgi:hypothetical protein
MQAIANPGFEQGTAADWNIPSRRQLLPLYLDVEENFYAYSRKRSCGQNGPFPFAHNPVALRRVNAANGH